MELSGQVRKPDLRGPAEARPFVEAIHGERLTRTLSARYYKDGAEILISMGDDGPPRRLTREECARLMGFSREHLAFDFVIPDGVSDVQAYRQFGNSVVVPQFTWIGSAIRDQAGDVFAIRMAGTPAR